MTVSRPGDRMTAVKIEILVVVARVDPYTLAALRRNGHLFVRGELKLFLARDDVVERVYHHKKYFTQRRKGRKDDGFTSRLCAFARNYGLVPTNIRPVFSSNP